MKYLQGAMLGSSGAAQSRLQGLSTIVENRCIASKTSCHRLCSLHWPARCRVPALLHRLAIGVAVVIRNRFVLIRPGADNGLAPRWLTLTFRASFVHLLWQRCEAFKRAGRRQRCCTRALLLKFTLLSLQCLFPILQVLEALEILGLSTGRGKGNVQLANAPRNSQGRGWSRQ